MVCKQWKMISALNMSLGKMSDFASFLLVGLTVVKKSENVWFWKSLTGFDSYRKIAVRVANVGVSDIRGQILKHIYQTSYLLSSD